ncbi:hypothetical protein [Nocardia aurantia]|uniref:Bacterial Ig-like domain-containing protein n=1 Tax=Nocardia aurantia TaxID=2585199 RepID=A0A7K0DYD9_9NOCA|nr:hypothetical protein [Nocardia aurantia]MQY30819.1 hypothetical protein [Nocardia aurantia]
MLSLRGFGSVGGRLQVGSALAAMVAAGIVALSGPGVAHAATTSVTVSGRASTACPATVTATVSGVNLAANGGSPGAVLFGDGAATLGIVLATVQSTTPTGATVVAAFEWHPATTGTHVLTAVYSGDSSGDHTTVEVGTGINLGSVCL